jgi:hypothetical protein
MPNWKVEFEVTHAHFADAMAAVRRLRGTSNFEMKEIYEGDPRSGKNGAHANGKMAGVEQLINSKPKEIFTPTLVAQLTNDSMKLAGQKLAYLAKAKRIRRVSTGKFAALRAK